MRRLGGLVDLREVSVPWQHALESPELWRSVDVAVVQSMYRAADGLVDTCARHGLPVTGLPAAYARDGVVGRRVGSCYENWLASHLAGNSAEA
jgi:hypothetical protein